MSTLLPKEQIILFAYGGFTRLAASLSRVGRNTP